MKIDDKVRLKKKFQSILPGTSGEVIKCREGERYKIKFLHDCFGDKLERPVTYTLDSEYLEIGGPLKQITVSDAVEKYKLSRSTIYDYLEKEKIIGRKENGIWKIIEQSLKEMET